MLLVAGAVSWYRNNPLLRRLDSAPQLRQAHTIAKGVDGADGQQRARADEDEGRVGAKEGGVDELEDGAEEGGLGGDLGVGEAELVEVVDVGEAEDDGG